MSTLIDRINSINQGVQDVKADFKTALENKNVTVSDLLKLKDYPNLINEIKGAVTENIDLTNLTPENIRAGVTINGVTGTLVEQWDVVISPNRPENPRNGTIWIRDLSDESNNESGDDSGGGDSGGNNTGGGDTGGDSNIKLVVSNAGSSNVNGVYTQYTGSDYIAYKNESTDIYLWLNPNYLDRASWIFSPSINYPETSGWLYGATDNGSQSPIGLGFYRFGGSGDMPIVELYQDGGDSEGGTSNADYIVSNASNSLADGEYYLTTETFADYPVYKNANGYVIYMTSSYGWCIAPAVGQAPTHGAQGNFDPVPPTTGWYGDVTVTVTKG